MSGLQSNNVCDKLFDIESLQSLSLPRLKKFKTACYKFIGNRFWCCEFRCEYMGHYDEHKNESKMAESNLNNINKVMAEKS